LNVMLLPNGFLLTGNTSIAYTLSDISKPLTDFNVLSHRLYIRYEIIRDNSRKSDDPFIA